MIVARITLITLDGEATVLESIDPATVTDTAALILGEYLEGAGIADDPALVALLCGEISKAEAALTASGIPVTV